MYRRLINLCRSLEPGNVLPSTITTRWKVGVKKGHSLLLKGLFRIIEGGEGESYSITLFAAIFSLAVYVPIAGADIPSPLLPLILALLPSLLLSPLSILAFTPSLHSYCSLFNCRYKNGQMLPFDGEGHSWRLSDVCAACR